MIESVAATCVFMCDCETRCSKFNKSGGR